MQIVTLVAGMVCIFAVLLDAFQTIILPRRASRTLSSYAAFLPCHMEAWAFLPGGCIIRASEDGLQLLRAHVADLSAGHVGGGLLVGFALIYLRAGQPVH